MVNLKKLALRSIVLAIRVVQENLNNCEKPECLEANSRAMRDLAEAFTLVKRGVMLPDYGRDQSDG